MWKYNGKSIVAGYSWVDTDGITHPSNWNVWPESKKVSMGLVWEVPVNPVDSRFYSGRDSDGNAVEKELDVVKSDAINVVNTTCKNKLSETDWYITRKTEKNIDVPAEITTYRDAVRDKNNELEALIDACTSVNAVIALYTNPVDSDGVQTNEPAPISDWPVLG